jgi:hypothetical protein
MNKLKLYFNREAFTGDGPATNAIVFATTAGVLAFSGSTFGTGCAVVTALIAAGYANKWHEKATGKPLWTPRTPFFGL